MKTILVNVYEALVSWYYDNIEPIYSFFRYDIHQGIKSFWMFRKAIWNFRPWDYSFNLEIFTRSIEWTAQSIDTYGLEIEKSKKPRIEQMNRFVWLARNYENSIEAAEAELGELTPRETLFTELGDGRYEFKVDDHARNVFARSDELEQEYWKEMWEIIAGDIGEEPVKDVDDGGNEYYIHNGKDARGWWS